MPQDPRYMQAVAGIDPFGSYYQQQPEQLSYPNQAGSAYLPGFGHVSDMEPGFGEESYLMPPDVPPTDDSDLPPGTMTPPEYGEPPSTINLNATPLGYAWTAVAVASTAAGAYHGYKRNQSVGWAIAWALLGGIFPIIVPAIALAQGFGKRKVGR